MIINGQRLTFIEPIKNMIGNKKVVNGLSYGLSEAGYDIRLKQDVYLNGIQRFKLASCIEEFNMPSDLFGVVHDKSSNARNKIFLGNTTIEPNWRGFLTVEIVYWGWKPIKLKAGQPIAQVVFHELKERAYYNGKYQNQEDKPVKTIYEK